MAKPGPKPSKIKNILGYCCYCEISVKATKKISNPAGAGVGVKVFSKTNMYGLITELLLFALQDMKERVSKDQQYDIFHCL